MGGKKRIHFDEQEKHKVLEPYQEIEVGDFTIHQPIKGEVLIKHESGELCEISEEDFETHLMELFRERL